MSSISYKCGSADFNSTVISKLLDDDFYMCPVNMSQGVLTSQEVADPTLVIPKELTKPAAQGRDTKVCVHCYNRLLKNNLLPGGSEKKADLYGRQSEIEEEENAIAMQESITQDIINEVTTSVETLPNAKAEYSKESIELTFKKLHAFLTSDTTAVEVFTGKLSNDQYGLECRLYNKILHNDRERKQLAIQVNDIELKIMKMLYNAKDGELPLKTVSKAFIRPKNSGEGIEILFKCAIDVPKKVKSDIRKLLDQLAGVAGLLLMNDIHASGGGNQDGGFL